MDERLLRGFQLGDCYIDPAGGRVIGPGGSTHLAPKALEILLVLAAKPGELVTHRQILEEVWGDGAGRHDGLSREISAIRHALDDGPANPRLIQTLPKRGYRLLVKPGFPEPPGTSREEIVSRSSSPRWFDELKRRGVLETGAAYLVVGWLLIQIAGETFEQLSLPDLARTFVVWFVILGFPISLILAWFIEFTRRGAVLDRDPYARPERKLFSGTYISIVGALLLASTGVFVFDRIVGLPVEDAGADTDRFGSEIVVDPNSIAVLPFLNISGTEEGHIFSIGLAEDVINRLAAIPSLRVSSRGDSFTLEPNSASEDVRDRLRVAYYLEGSVRVVDDTMRVVVQLIDSESGFHLVSRQFNVERSGFFELQDEITRLTVANLRVALPVETRTSAAANEETSLDAYVTYRMGMDALHESTTSETLERALDAFERALAIDPGYAAAHAGICLARAAGYRATNNAAHIRDAEMACAQALTLNANLDVVHAALGELYTETGRYEDAEASFKAALAVNPKSVNSLLGLGGVYSSQQRFEEAESAYRQAQGLEPGNWRAHNTLGSYYFRNGRYDEAVAQFEEVVSLDYGNQTGWSNLGASFTLLGRFGDALDAYERALEIEPAPITYSNLGLLHYYLGEFEVAAVALRDAIDLSANDFLIWSNLGDVLTFGGDLDEARVAFSRAEELARENLGINGRNAETIASLAWITAMLGESDEAEQLIATADALAPGDPYVSYIGGLILSRHDDSVGAIEKLRNAAEMGYPTAMIAGEPHLAALRSEPGFQDLIADFAP